VSPSIAACSRLSLGEYLDALQDCGIVSHKLELAVIDSCASGSVHSTGYTETSLYNVAEDQIVAHEVTPSIERSWIPLAVWRNLRFFISSNSIDDVSVDEYTNSIRWNEATEANDEIRFFALMSLMFDEADVARQVREMERARLVRMPGEHGSILLTRPTAAARTNCRRWLAAVLNERDPAECTKDVIKAEALSAIAGLSADGFDAAWREEAFGPWTKGGRRKKSLHSRDAGHK